MTIFKASLDPQYWSDLLPKLSEVCDDNPVSLLACSPGSAQAPVVISHGLEDSYAESYGENYNRLNCWAPRFSQRRPGEVFKIANVMETRDLVRTEFYNDWLKPQDNLSGGAGVILTANGETAFCLGTTVRFRNLEKNEEIAAQWIGKLLPFVLQAQQVSRALDGLKLESFAARQNLNAGGAAIFVISAKRTLLQMNDVAHEMLEQLDGPVHLLPGNRIGMREMSVEDHLDIAIATEQRGLDRLALPFPLRGANNSFFSARAIPLDAASAAEVSPNWFGHRPPAAVLLIVERAVSTLGISHRLTERFGLTKSEVDIVDRIAGGSTLEQIAEARQASIHTVRSQLKSAMGKTGTRRQADLATLVERVRRA